MLKEAKDFANKAYNASQYHELLDCMHQNGVAGSIEHYTINCNSMFTENNYLTDTSQQ